MLLNRHNSTVKAVKPSKVGIFLDTAIVDQEIKSKFDKHVRDAKTAACKNQCRCQPVCICNDAVALQKALDSQKGAALDGSE